jgi:hypothetical protein
VKTHRIDEVLVNLTLARGTVQVELEERHR